MYKISFYQNRVIYVLSEYCSRLEGPPKKADDGSAQYAYNTAFYKETEAEPRPVI